MKNAENLDPMSLIIGADVADALFVSHRFDDSVQQSKKTFALDPNFAMGHCQVGQALAQ